MNREKHLSIKRLVGLCKRIPDERRRSGNFKHEMVDVLVICLVGIICGYETWAEIRDYAQAKRLFLWRHLGLKRGIPSAATMRRVLGMIKPAELESVYREWVKPYIGSCLGKHIPVDGKTIRGASRRGEANFHMVSAWVREDGVTIQRKRKIAAMTIARSTHLSLISPIHPTAIVTSRSRLRMD